MSNSSQLYILCGLMLLVYYTAFEIAEGTVLKIFGHNCKKKSSFDVKSAWIFLCLLSGSLLSDRFLLWAEVFIPIPFNAL